MHAHVNTVLDYSDILEGTSLFGVHLDRRVFETPQEQQYGDMLCRCFTLESVATLSGYWLEFFPSRKLPLKNATRAHFHKAVSGKWVKKYKVGVNYPFPTKHGRF